MPAPTRTTPTVIPTTAPTTDPDRRLNPGRVCPNQKVRITRRVERELRP
jgi:hypothetical protein